VARVSQLAEDDDDAHLLVVSSHSPLNADLAATASYEADEAYAQWYLAYEFSFVGY
jgi:hypothetical protein